MGACVSFHRKASATKVQSDHLMIPTSPTKQKPPIINGDVPVKPQWPPLQSPANFCDFGSKEEKFFDSQAWLDSDCESDFMSVNGEFTPSRGSTPVHHNFSAGPPGAATIDHYKLPVTTPSHPSQSPTKKRVRLSDLFKESLRANHDLDEANVESGSESEPVESPAMSVRGGGLKPKRGRRAVPMSGCFPGVLSTCRLVAIQQMEGRRK